MKAIKEQIIINESKMVQLAFHCNDFTGVTDALEYICRARARAVLFIEHPEPEESSNVSFFRFDNTQYIMVFFRILPELNVWYRGELKLYSSI